MRIDRVTAVAFGPLVGDTLELAPGMNVICGPNESGKSSWHAAMYVALCGRRRSRGQPTKEDRAFAARHRPWHGSRWRVQAVVSLDDGRVIEIDQRLGQGSHSVATDRATGRDVTSELERGGSVDVSSLLGLSRETALATLFVRQADMLRVLADASELQEYLERAAATSTADATADEALARIDTYRRERIGVVRVGARGPLATATRLRDEARAAFDEVEARFENYQQLLAQKRDAEIDANTAEEALSEVQAHERERLRLDEWLRITAAEQRLSQARSLEQDIAAGPQEAGPSKDLVASVNRALAAYEARPPEPPQLEGPTAAELARDLAELPEPPAGDVEPSAAVDAALNAWRTATQRLTAHDEHQPTVTAASDLPAPAAELRRLADDLDALVPEIDQGLAQEVERRRAQAVAAPVPAVPPRPTSPVGPAATSPGAGGGGARVALGAGVGVIILGVVLGALGQIIVGGIAAVAGVILAAVGGVASGRRGGAQPAQPAYPPPPPPPPPPPSDPELPRLEARLIFQQEANAQASARRTAAAARAAELGLPAESTRLRALAADGESADVARSRHGDWLARRNQIVEEVGSSAERLRDALVAGGVPTSVDSDLEAAHARYVADTQQRAEVARRAARRPDLEARHASRQAAEAAREQDLTARVEAERQLLDAATAAGCTAATPDQTASSLRDWLGWAEQQAEANQEQAKLRARLEQLLDGRTFDELDTEIARLAAAAGERPPDEAPVLADRSAELQELADRAHNLRQRAAELIGQAETAESHLTDVSTAIEAEAQAEAEVRRLGCLGEDLDFAAHVLESAQQKVHADIAPVLAETIRPWVPSITQGRYDDIRVDPKTLEIEAREVGLDFHPATVLSHGTTEQLFLLLRLALAEHLATTGESAPIVLDDVTVQSDTQRTTAILDLLHDLSTDRQVVIFSQEDEVVRWAERALEPTCDRLIRLTPPLAGV